MDYSKIGLKIGLEIHQQLDTHKLFCNCNSELTDEVTSELTRQVESVSGTRLVRYQAVPNSCGVEANSDPPHAPNQEAIDIALQIIGLLKATPVNELVFKHKPVLEGPNPSRVQRTGIIGNDGEIELESGEKIGIPTICLEEDAARKIEETDSEVIYRLDRLGIPLVEITTAPDIHTPHQAKEVARRIGELLAATGKVKQDLGAIRQDINISVEGGARCEIKLVQELNAIPKVVELEVLRQLRLIKAKEELNNRGIKESDLTNEYYNVTQVFQNTESKLLKNILIQNGMVLGIKLPGFSGLLLNNLGFDLADYARTMGLKGLLHSDELPGYGVGELELQELHRITGTGPQDAFVIVAGTDVYQLKGALDIMLDRSRIALDGVPNEVRGVQEDCTSVYQRPLSTSDQMETVMDIQPVKITEEKYSGILSNLPETPDEKRKRLVTDFGIAQEQARQLIVTEKAEIFEQLVKEAGYAKVVATTLLNTLPELRNDGLAVEKISFNDLQEIFRSLGSNQFSKEAVPEILMMMLKDDLNVSAAMSNLGVASVGTSEVEITIDKLLEVPEHQKLISEKGSAALKPLMGMAMKTLRGKADGALVSQVLEEKLGNIIQKE